MNGKKTYIVAGLIGLAAGARALGWLDDGIYQMILGLLGAGGLAALRDGVTKSGPAGPAPFSGLDVGGPGTGQ
jgi:hypothetical protein